MIQTTVIEAALAAAIRWLTESGIQNRDHATASGGGFHAYLKRPENEYSYIYSEITGYALTTLAYLAQFGQRETLTERARAAADWLAKFARCPRSGGYLCRYEPGLDRFAPERVCTFDSAMALNGLVAWHRLTGEAFFRHEAEIVSGFVLGMQNGDGSFHVRLLGPNRKIENTFQTWSTQSGSFLAKNALGLLHLHRVTGDDTLTLAARRAADFALTCQAPEGRFYTHLVERYTLQHPHCYTIEALLAAGSCLEEPRYLEAAFKAIDWSLSVQLSDGGFVSTAKPAPEPDNIHQRMDIQSQVLRAALWAADFGYRPDMAAVERGLTRLLAMQARDPDPRVDGAILYGWDDHGQSLSHPNSWVTMFAIQALRCYLQRLDGQSCGDILLLV